MDGSCMVMWFFLKFMMELEGSGSDVCFMREVMVFWCGVRFIEDEIICYCHEKKRGRLCVLHSIVKWRSWWRECRCMYKRFTFFFVVFFTKKTLLLFLFPWWGMKRKLCMLNLFLKGILNLMRKVYYIWWYISE